MSSDDEAGRAAAARHDDLPGWVLNALAADRSALVRAEVASRPGLPDALVAVLADPRTEPDPTVLRRMAAHPGIAVRALALAATADVVALRRLAENPATPRDALAVLAGHPDPAVHRRARARIVGAGLDDDARARLPVGLRAYLT
ncbi:MAG TPA: hypothetical protein VFI47_18610 [Acidimicrobiales bacterium]|nr:hypothetical protein [Acidimicrobiales bacterium]